MEILKSILSDQKFQHDSHFSVKKSKIERVHRILTNFFTFSKLKCSSYIPIRKYICCVLQYLLYWYNSVMYFNIFCTGTILWCTAVSAVLVQPNSVLLYLLYWYNSVMLLQYLLYRYNPVVYCSISRTVTTQ